MPVGVQCPITSPLGEFPSYWDRLWCSGLSPVLVSIALPFGFHTWCFPFALICHWISIVFLLYGRRIATHYNYNHYTHMYMPPNAVCLILPSYKRYCTYLQQSITADCLSTGKLVIFCIQYELSKRLSLMLLNTYYH